ncbi:MAG: hypothetical protein ACREN2_11440 [Candidatus Dormibacteria bacterium]
MTGLEWQREPGVYFIYDVGNDRVKIGYATDPYDRMTTLKTGNSQQLLLLAVAVRERNTMSVLTTLSSLAIWSRGRASGSSPVGG